MALRASGSEFPEGLADSPFVELGCPFTLYEAFKMALLLPLLPLRLAFGGLALVAIATINSLAAWNWPLDTPLTPWRRRVVLLSKELVLVVLWCLGFRLRVRGRENIKLGERMGAVAVFNHVSWVDAFIVVWLMAPSGVSKESNGRIPVIGQAVRALQTVYIPYNKLSKRASPGAASACAAPAAALAASAEPAGDGASAGLSRLAATARTRSDGSCSSGSSCDDSDGGSNVSKVSCTSGDSRGSGGSSSSGCGPSEATKCANGVSSAECAASAPIAIPAAAAISTAADALSTQMPPSPPASSSSQRGPGSGRGDVVTSNVTEVLLRRVNHPSYCQPGGFPMVIMAPEGTTANGRGLLNFRTGAFVLRRPVLPICLRYRWRGVNPAWTIGDVRWQFLRLMCQFRNDLEVEILPPYKPSQDELKDCRLFASHVRRQMACVLGVPRVDASHDDYLELARRGVGVSWDGRRVTVRGSDTASGGGRGGRC
ncbi:hypothetical protein PLESTF_001258800 [Pleodorina starrii]|nr:hypothetical protein PLESTF_001258800 [Pleodorina starrii]